MGKVLYSPGYGAGWSSWNTCHGQFLATDPGLVSLAEAGADEDEVRAYLVGKFGPGFRSDIYLGGWRDIRVAEMPSGTAFLIDEHDGHETIKVISDFAMVVP